VVRLDSLRRSTLVNGMKPGAYDPSTPDDMSVAVRRVALVVVCAALFAIFGVAAPYKIYKHFEAQQDAFSAAAMHEEL
jgi:hypothetical protein